MPAHTGTPLEDRLLAFIRALRAGSVSALTDFLPDGPGRSEALVELVHAELEYRLERGEAARVEQYLVRFPELGGAPLADLVAAEFRLRGRAEPALDAAAETRRRFPWLASEVAEPATTAPTCRYTRGALHARGGLGEVYLARDEELGRPVALKEIQRRHSTDEGLRARFVREAELTGSLEHPGIVPVYGMGRYPDGLPFYAMRFVQGGTLENAIKAHHIAPTSEQPLSLRGLLARFVAVCNAVSYAHSRGVIHRDLKPANVMLGEFGETLVVDWGLAKRIGSEEGDALINTTGPTKPSSAETPAPERTATGCIVGTPAYAPPEQVLGQHREVGQASDVYSLGATLYQIITGQVPVEAASLDETLERVVRGDIPLARRVNPLAPAALEAVCHKAMANDPADRYASAAELAKEVERWLADEPVSAYRESLSQRLARWGRRHPTFIAGAVTLLLAGIVALGTGAALIGREQSKTALALQDLKDEQQRRALGQVDRLCDAAPEATPGILEELRQGGDEVLDEIRKRHQTEADGPRKVRLALALLPNEPAKVRKELVEAMFTASEPAEVVLIRDQLVPHSAGLAENLWHRTEDAMVAEQERFRALVALAGFDPSSPRWQRASARAVERMLGENPLHLGVWVLAMEPVSAALRGPLGTVFRDRRPEKDARREGAAQALKLYLTRRPDAQTLYELLLDADARQHALLRPLIEAQPDRAADRMHVELARQHEYQKEGPLDPAWKSPDAALVAEVEGAGGLVAERFALCQVLPLDRLTAVTETLRSCGYRPIGARPYEEERVAVVWARDGRDWKLQVGLSEQELKQRDTYWGAAGLDIADVAAYPTKQGDRFVALWAQPSAGEKMELFAGVATKKFQAEIDRAMGQGFFPGRMHVLGTGESRRYSGVWWTQEDRRKSEDAVLFEKDEAMFAGHVADGTSLIQDVHLSGLDAKEDSPSHLYDSTWRNDSARDSRVLHGLRTKDHLARCRSLAAEGYRPVALSLASVKGAPLAASVWHRPTDVPGKEALARRQANAAATLLWLRRPEKVWSLMRHSPEPTRRSWLVWMAGEFGSDPRQLIARLRQEKDDSARRALILALGDYHNKDLPESVRAPLVADLLRWYRDDSDPGIHAAIGWLLRHSHEGPAERRLDWGQAAALTAIDRQLAGKKPQTKPANERGSGDAAGWYVTSEGHTMVMFAGPVEFGMGSPLSEPGRVPPNERPHRRRIDRSFSLASAPVTVAQWQRFMKERPKVKETYLERLSTDGERAVGGVNYFEAMMYCNWLSAKEGLPETEWCYPEPIDIGMKPHPDYLRRTGYRLPSEPEWEYACKAGSLESRYFGSAVELVPRYSHFMLTNKDHTWPVGQKRPNDFGLFDMNGQVWNWCGEVSKLYPPRASAEPTPDREDVTAVTMHEKRVLRGLSFLSPAQTMRSAYRASDGPGNRSSAFGLRVCRTLPPGLDPR